MTPTLIQNRLLSLLRQALGWLAPPDPTERLSVIWRALTGALRARMPTGMYEVLECDVRLELADASGKQAVLHKRERVRFLQDNIIAYQDKAWGDGDIFADYQCSPGRAVDRYREGHLTRVLISLRQTKNQGDLEEFRMTRTIHGGFTHTVEDLQVDVDHWARSLTIAVVFPHDRPPRQAMLIQQNAARSRLLERDAFIQLPGGDWEIRARVDNPRRHEGYILRWQW